jgi:hypothetical protein
MGTPNSCRCCEDLMELRDHLTELTGNELKLWTYIYHHDENTAYAANETLGKCTRLAVRTIKVCKRRLRKKGWLVTVGFVPARNGGEYPVPIEKAVMPWVAAGQVQNLHSAESSQGQELHPGQVQNLHPEVSYCSSVSVCPSVSSSSTAGICSSPSAPAERREDQSGNQEPSNHKPKPKAAPDGTPWPDSFDSWPNRQRLLWLASHQAVAGDKQPRSQRKDMAQTPLAQPPGSAIPPGATEPNYCRDCGNDIPPGINLCGDCRADSFTPTTGLCSEFCDECQTQPGHPHDRNCLLAP